MRLVVERALKWARQLQLRVAVASVQHKNGCSGGGSGDSLP